MQPYFERLKKLEVLIGAVEDQLWLIGSDLPDNQKKDFREVYDLTHKIFTTAASHHALEDMPNRLRNAE